MLTEESLSYRDFMDDSYIPDNLDDMKSLLPSLANKCVASRYEQALKLRFNPLLFAIKTYSVGPKYTTAESKEISIFLNSKQMSSVGGTETQMEASEE